MTKDELEHCLKTLVELDLWFRIKALEEGTKIRNIEAERKQVIKNFLGNLPSQYKSIDGYQEIVLETIKRLMQKRRGREEER